MVRIQLSLKPPSKLTWRNSELYPEMTAITNYTHWHDNIRHIQVLPMWRIVSCSDCYFTEWIFFYVLFHVFQRSYL